MCAEAVKRSAIDAKDVGHVVLGNVIHTDARDHYLARVASVNGGLPHETPALALNRLCGSGLPRAAERFIVEFNRSKPCTAATARS